MDGGHPISALEIKKKPKWMRGGVTGQLCFFPFLLFVPCFDPFQLAPLLVHLFLRKHQLFKERCHLSAPAGLGGLLNAR